MSKKLIALLLAAVFLSIPAVAYADSAAVTAGHVNFRSGPGTDFPVKACLSQGTVLDVLDTRDGVWYAVKYNGETGYISAQYLKFIGGNSSVTPFSTAAPSVNEMTASEETPVPQNTPAPSAELPPVSSPETSSVPSTDPSSQTDPASEPAASAPTPTPGVNSATAIGIAGVSDSMSPVIQDVINGSAVTISSDSGSGSIGGDYVRFRTGPGTTYKILGTYNRGKALTIVGKADDWVKCEIDGKTGFVFGQYVIRSGVQAPADPAPVQKVDYTEGYISGNNVRFREGPSTSSGIIKEFYYGNSVTITGISGDWTAVSSDSKSGYVFSQYVKQGSYSVPAAAEQASVSTGNVSAQDLVTFAMQYLGFPYKYGGTDPSTGFDCSGFVYYVYSHFNISLNRVAADQARNGTAVSASSLQPGDILCFYSNGSTIGHTGIYIGDNKFIHCANSNTGVIITELSGYYSSRGFEARRILG